MKKGEINSDKESANNSELSKKELIKKSNGIFKFNELGILLVLVLIVLIIYSFRPGYLSISTLANVGQRAAVYGIISFGMVYLISMGEIDLSVGAIYAFTLNAAGAMIMAGMNPWLAAILGLLTGVCLGAINGLLSNFLKKSVMIVSLGTLSMFRGLTLIMTSGTTLWGLPRDHSFFINLGGRLFGIPIILIIFFALTIILTIIYKNTRYGFIIRAIGSNTQAARLGGINIPRIRILTLMMVGGLCGISGIMTLAFFATGDPTIGSGYELHAIAAAIIGGTALTGGNGSILGALLGAFVIATISSGIVQFGISANWSIFVTGAMIVASVALDSYVRQKQEK